VRYYWKITSNNTDLSALAYIIEGVSMRLDRLFSRVWRAIPLLAAASLLLLLSACSKSEPTQAEMQQAVEAKLAESGLHFSGFKQFTKLNCFADTNPAQPNIHNDNQPIPGDRYLCQFQYLTNSGKSSSQIYQPGLNPTGAFSNTGYFGKSWYYYEDRQDLLALFM
jgi:hypothetical protein